MYRFETFELDPPRFELRESGQARRLEPQVLALLILLVGNCDRLVSKDEIVENVWNGRAISDSAISARIKLARRAIGDDGEQQRLIRTIHGKGFRFAGKVAFVHELPSSIGPKPAGQGPQQPQPGADAAERPSIAVLPFRISEGSAQLAIVADALPDELILDLARLRWLLVIARGSSFRFRSPHVDARDVGQALNVKYCLAGSIGKERSGVSIQVELARTEDGAVIWAERFAAGTDDIEEVRHAILHSVVANLELQISRHEATLARRIPAGGLSAWSAYHLGLDMMFRFNKADNAHAAQFFTRALELDPDFGRALGGLSFTRFQDAFLRYSPDPQAAAKQALALAENALRCDLLDPFAQLNLGRALWLDGSMEESIDHLAAAITLSPSYAQALYSKAWAEMIQCDCDQSDSDVALALQLSPLDPLRYGMLGVRSLSAFVRGDYENAALWGERAARSSGAHKHIALIAALGTQLAGQNDRARQWVGRARQSDAEIAGTAFLRAFPFAPSATRDRIVQAFRALAL